MPFSFVLWRDDANKLVMRRNETLLSWEIVENYGATVNPGSLDDANDGYIWGSVWTNITTNTVWVCTNPAAGAAIWKDISEIGGGAGTVPDNYVSNFKLADVETYTIKGRISAGSGDPQDLVPADARTVLNIEDGATADGATGDAFAASHDGSGGTAHALATQTTAGFMSTTDKGYIDNSTESATPNTFMWRDANGNASVATPVNSDHIANKAFVESFTGGGGTTAGGGVVTPTVMGVFIENSTTETIVATFPIPANSLTTTFDSVHVSLLGQILNSSGTTPYLTIKVLLGSTEVMTDATVTIPSVATYNRVMLTNVVLQRDSNTTVRGYITNVMSEAGATTAPQVGQGDLGANRLNHGPLASAHASPTVSWSTSNDLTIKITLSAANANFTYRSYVGSCFIPRRMGGIMKLDDLLSPDDNTDLNASAFRHGLLPKLSGDSSAYLNGGGGWTVPPGGGGTGGYTGTVLAVYSADPVLSATDDVLEVYKGSRITLPAFNAGKPDRITIINAGNATSLIRGSTSRAIVLGGVFSDITGVSATRLQLSTNSPSSMGNSITISFWIRGVSTNTTHRNILHIGDGIADSTSYFRVYLNYDAGNTYVRIGNKNNNVVNVTRRWQITQNILHHIVISLNMATPTSTCSIDGIVVGHDTGFAGDVFTSGQDIGGASQIIRIASGITGNSEEWLGSLSQVQVNLTYVDLAQEQNRRKFYNDGPVWFGSNGLTFNSIAPIVYMNSFPSGTPATAPNGGTLGGNFVDQTAGSSITALDSANLDAAILEQIDGYPAGFSLPVTNEVRLIRRSTKGVWGVF